MLWLVKARFVLIGCLYLAAALIMTVVFVPALVALCLCFLSVCIFNVSFYKMMMMGSFTKTITLVTACIGRSSVAFRALKNLD